MCKEERSPFTLPLACSEKCAVWLCRITTLGSGTPDVRRQQVASSFLIELGNGDKFIWDMGTGSYVNLIATGVPAANLTKVLALLSGISSFALLCAALCFHLCR